MVFQDKLYLHAAAGWAAVGISWLPKWLFVREGSDVKSALVQNNEPLGPKLLQRLFDYAVYIQVARPFLVKGPVNVLALTAISAPRVG